MRNKIKFTRLFFLAASVLVSIHNAGGQEMTLETLARGGMKSDSYRSVTARHEGEIVPALQSQIPLDTSITFGGTKSEDRRKPLFDTLPNKIFSTAFNLGVSTQFLSGTNFAVDLGHGFYDVGFPKDPPASFYESKGTLTVSQSLWRNYFGSGSRLGRRAGDVLADANRQASMETEELWFSSLLEVFYKTWLAQAQERAAKDNVTRRERLAQITKNKVTRGLGEEPDTLQVESALIKSRTQLTRMNQALEERWNELVGFAHGAEPTAKAPTDPLSIDTPTARALELCGAGLPESSSTTRKLARQAEGAALKKDQTENARWPALDLKASVYANGISDERKPSVDQTLGRENPGWSLGFQLTLPVFNYEKDADAQAARAEFIQSEAAASLAKRNLVLQWANLCSDVKRWEQIRGQLEQAFNNQKRRSELEENRFRLARGATLNVIQAGDDLTQSEIDLRQAEVESRFAAWKVRRVKGDMSAFLRGLGDRP